MMSADEPKEHRVATSAGELFVEETGQGPPIVFWHSMYVDRRMFDAQVAAFSDNYRCIAIDAPGHGRSGTPPKRMHFDDCVAAAKEVLDVLEISGVRWVGCAFGGHIGVALAAAHPEYISSLVVLNAPMAEIDLRSRLRLHLLINVYRQIGPIEPIARSVVSALLSPAHREKHGEYVTNCISDAEKEGMLRAMRAAVLGRPALRDSLPDVSCPTLFVTSDDDGLWTAEAAQEDAAFLPDGEFVIVPNTRHLTPLEDPVATNRLLVQWLSEADSPEE